MPVIKSAKKKLRQDRKRRAQNLGVKNTLKALVKDAKQAKTEKAVRAATQAADKAAKVKVIHKNKAARIKSTLSKLVPHKQSGTKKEPTRTPTKKTSEKVTKAYKSSKKSSK